MQHGFYAVIWQCNGETLASQTLHCLLGITPQCYAFPLVTAISVHDDPVLQFVQFYVFSQTSLIPPCGYTKLHVHSGWVQISLHPRNPWYTAITCAVT